MTLARVAVWPVPSVAGQAQLRSLVIGAGTPYAIETIDGLDLPAVSPADASRAGADGSFGGLETTAFRSLVLALNIHPDTIAGGSSKAVLAQALKAAFSESSDDLGFTYQDPDLGPLLFIGRPRRCSFQVDRTRPWKSQEGVMVEFLALDPLIYSGVIDDVVIAYGTAGTNAGVPANSTAAGLGVSAAPRRFVQNPSFEQTATTPWLTTVSTDLAAGATLTRDVVTFHDGVAAGKLVTSGASVNQGVRQVTLTNLLPLTTYTATAWVNLTTAGGSIRLYARDVTNAAVALGTAQAALGAWARLTVTFTTGVVGPVQVEIGCRDEGTAVARTFYVDGAQIDVGAVAQPYVDVVGLMGVTAGAIGGGGGAAGFQQLSNAGTAPSAPVSRITAVGGPVTGPLYLERVESGEVIQLNLNLAAGDFIELDHDLHSVSLNGVANRADVVDSLSAWWVVPPGLSTIHYRTGGPGAGSVAEIKFRDANW